MYSVEVDRESGALLHVSVREFVPNISLISIKFPVARSTTTTTGTRSASHLSADAQGRLCADMASRVRAQSNGILTGGRETLRWRYVAHAALVW